MNGTTSPSERYALHDAAIRELRECQQEIKAELTELKTNAQRAELANVEMRADLKALKNAVAGITRALWGIALALLVPAITWIAWAFRVTIEQRGGT